MIDTREADRLLTESERALVRARLALHAAEDATRFTVDCADTDGDGDCPRCLTRTGFAEGEPQYWRCARAAHALWTDAWGALQDATEEAKEATRALGLHVDPAANGGGWDGNG